MDTETIVAAAIQDPTGKIWTTPAPARHHNIICLMREAGVPKFSGGQGFMTSTGRFVGRKEAADIAVEAGQVKRDELIMPGTGLDSSDVW